MTPRPNGSRPSRALPGIRGTLGSRPGRAAAEGMRRLNARHPWNHNHHFHAWILTRLPERREAALDLGCGRGDLLALLAEEFTTVHGSDIDADMREAARRRTAGLPNVQVDQAALEEFPDSSLDLVTMVAVLHHLDIPAALDRIRRVLAPGGKLLVVGLAPPATLTDHAWDVASMVTNPVIGLVKHPWPAPPDRPGPSIPIQDPTLTFDGLQEIATTALPGARMRHHLGFRHTLEWTRPAGEHA